jgi:flagellar secretion chaperone FliS
MTSPAMRARYLADSVNTASPARLLVMLYERLVLDLSQAEAALTAADRTTASDRILHAQEIVLELRTTLDESVWEGAAGLAQIYGFVLNELIQANINADGAQVASCRGLLEPLLDAWRQAALSSAETSARGA